MERITQSCIMILIVMGIIYWVVMMVIPNQRRRCPEEEIIQVGGMTAPLEIQTHQQQYHSFPIYCINLETETLRRNHIRMAFAPLSSRIEFVAAVDTRENKWQEYIMHLNEEGVKQLQKNLVKKKRDFHFELTPGAIGCFLSHIKTWRQFQTQYPDQSFALILEDDSIPKPAFFSTLMKTIDNIPKDADIILLNYLMAGEKTRVDGFFRMGRRSIFYLLNCYIITQQGAGKILDQFENKDDSKFHKQIDSYMTDLIRNGIITVYCIPESICPQAYITPTSIQVWSV